MNARSTKPATPAPAPTQKAAIVAEVVLTNPGMDDAVCALNLSFANGKKLQVDANQLTSGIRCMAMLHGLKQKLVDAAAISRDPETGRAATIDTKYEAVKAVFDRLTGTVGGEPSWNATREAGSGGAGGLLFQALCRLYPKRTPESLKEYLAGKTDAEKAALRKNPKVADVIETIKAEHAKPGGEDRAAELLAELEAEMGEEE